MLLGRLLPKFMTKSQWSQIVDIEIIETKKVKSEEQRLCSSMCFQASPFWLWMMSIACSKDRTQDLSTLFAMKIG